MEKTEKVYYNSDCPVTRERHTWIESFSGGKLEWAHCKYCGAIWTGIEGERKDFLKSQKPKRTRKGDSKCSKE